MLKNKRFLIFIFCLIILVSISACQVINTSPVITIEPYLVYTGENNQMKVMWHLLENMKSSIEWGTDTSYSLGLFQTSQIDSDHTHSFTFENLVPGNTYYYRVSFDGESLTGTFQAPPPEDETNLKFFAYGDTRSSPAVHNMVSSAIISTYTLDPEYQTFIIHVGDIINDGDDVYSWAHELFSPQYDSIRQMMKDLPFQACMGNHEGSGILFEKYLPYPFANPRYYSFDYGPAHVVVVDQYTDYRNGSQQYNWIVQELSSTSKQWKFLVMHEPGWSAGGHENNVLVQQHLHPLCIEYEVAIVFSGHNHYYSRAVVDGVHYVTTGGGGAPLRSPETGRENIVSTSSSYHFGKIEIVDNALTFNAVKPDGTVIDQFILQ
jgi:hypothetical protein